jgi:DNA-binding GntR family transcriptional regulator
MAIEHLYRYTDDVTTIDSTPLDDSLARLDHAFTAADDPHDRLEASHRFHAALVALSGNSRITTAYELLTMQVKLCMSLNLRTRQEQETPEQNVERHRVLRDAVLSGDLSQALQAITDHGHDAFAQDAAEGRHERQTSPPRAARNSRTASSGSPEIT